MKATGIVRRIDELGRVVIPMEIRRTMRIREGDPLEIFTDKEGELILRKYSPMESLDSYAVYIADSIAETVEKGVIICDKDTIIAVSGLPKKDYINHNISKELLNIMEGRRTVLNLSDNLVKITADGEIDFKSQVISPIVAGGDLYGAIVILPKEKDMTLSETDMKVAITATNYLSKQLL